MSVSAPGTVIGWLIDTVSKGGTLLLNLSPMADGTIPQAQQDTLRGVGAWLEVNGEAIYGTRPWTKYIEGNTGRGQLNYHFTTKGNTLYAIASAWPSGDAVIESLAPGKVSGKVTKVELLGHDGALEFSQEDAGLKITLPEKPKTGYAYVFKISGLDLRAGGSAQATAVAAK
jgi:alpha-L-fucosidase